MALASFLALHAPPATAAPTSQSPDSIVIQKFGVNDGKSLLTSLLEKVKAMHDYWYESTLTTFEKQKPVTEKGRFYFKTPNLVRFEALDAGSRSGSVVVKQADGKIKAKAGGLMGGITVSLSPNSKLLKTPNGYSIVESDLATLLEGVLHVSDGQKLVASPSPCPYPGLGRALVLELVGANNLVVQRLALDQESKLPVDWLIFENNKLDSICHIEKLIPNANIADSLFRLGKESTVAGSDMKKSLGGTALLCAGLARKLASFRENATLDSQTKFDIKSVVDQINFEATQLKNEFAASQSAKATEIVNYDQSNSSLAQSVKVSGNPLILLRATAIESMADSLESAAPPIKNFDAITGSDIGSPALATSWQRSLDMITESVASLYSLLDTEKPDSTAVNAEAEKIIEQTKKLDGVLKWISTPKVVQ